MDNNKKGLSKLKELFWFSDSEPNEVLIAFCHLVALPAALIAEFPEKPFLLCMGAIGAGSFQMWAVLWSGALKYRLLAVQLATIIAIITVINLSIEGLMYGSRVGWVIIMFFAMWNTVRVFKEKIERYG
jgi:hypothetical protein